LVINVFLPIWQTGSLDKLAKKKKYVKTKIEANIFTTSTLVLHGIERFVEGKKKFK